VRAESDRLPGPVIAIVGPTATGKSALSVALARALPPPSGQQFGAEVVNADSMQLYRGMDIGTAKVTAQEAAGVPHHLLDIWEVTQTASVEVYQRQAREVIENVLKRGTVPLLVGGSGLYVRAVLDRMEFPGTDPALRARLEEELAQVGPAALHARLAELDPQAAAAILPSNGRRIVRALEVVALTGRFNAQLPPPEPVYDALRIGLDCDNALLDERIAQRVERMWQAGFVDEVRALAAAGLRAGRTASRALGYQQVLDYLDGRCDEEQAKAATVTATRRFARRQRSWFRRDPRVYWVDATRPDLLEVVLEKVAERFPQLIERARPQSGPQPPVEPVGQANRAAGRGAGGVAEMAEVTERR